MTPKQEEALRDYLQEGIVPLIEEVLVKKLGQAMTFAKKELAEQPAQQEPVAWGVDWGRAGDIPCVSIIKRLVDGRIEVVAVEYAPYSYTSPPAQRTWVGLTDEEIERACVPLGAAMLSFTEVARAIEAKLRSKNEDRI